MNGRYMRELGTDELTRRLEELTGRTGLRDAVAISEEKIQTLADFWPLAGLHLRRPRRRPRGAREVARPTAAATALADARDALARRRALRRRAHRAGAARRGRGRAASSRKDVFQPMRVALAGTTVSPGIFETLEVLGRDESLRAHRRGACGPEKLPRRQSIGHRAQSPVHTCR